MNETLSNDELELLDRVACAVIEPVPPPSAVRGRILDAIRGLPQRDESVPSAEESVTVRADAGERTQLTPGVRTTRLTTDARRAVFLLELEPQAVLPAHDHDEGGEDSYVIRGSCHIGGIGLYQGDFHHTDAGSHHGDVVASDEGCLLLITMEVKAA